MKFSEAKTARDVFSHKIHNSILLEFYLERFTEYQAVDKEWRLTLTPICEEFNKYCEECDAGKTEIQIETMKLVRIVDNGLMFIASNPVFSVSEMAKAGAYLTDKEKQKFIDEFHEILQVPSKRKVLHPAVAAIGWELVKHLAPPGSPVNNMVQAKKAEIDEFLAAGIIRNTIDSVREPWLKSIKILDKLDEVGIEIDKDGNVSDPEGVMKQETKNEEDYARRQSKTGTSEEGSTGVQ